MLQNASSLIGQLGTVHICDLLTEVKHTYEPYCLLFYALVPAVYLLQVGHRNIPPLVHALGSKPTPTCHTRNDKLRFA